MADSWRNGIPVQGADAGAGVQQSPFGARGTTAAAQAAVATGISQQNLEQERLATASAEAQVEIARIEAAEANMPPEARMVRDAAKIEAEILAKSQAEARAAAIEQLPSIRNQTQTAINTVVSLLNHPGFGAVVGMPIPFKGGFGYFTVPWTEARGAAGLLEQVRGQAFLEAFASIKGGGAISEREGAAATDAITRMRGALSEADFRKAANDFMRIAAQNVETIYNTATKPLYSETMGSTPPTPEPTQEDGMARGGSVRRDLMSLRERYGL